MSPGERGRLAAGHREALGQKFIVINLQYIHVHIVQDNSKSQTGEAPGPFT